MTTEHKREASTPRASSKERRVISQELVQKLVAERTEMLSLYVQLAGVDPYTHGKNSNGKSSRAKPSLEVLQKFCQVLVDYIAAGHFSLYERIVNGTERRQQIAALAEKLYPEIADTTESALDFNDKYDCGDHCEITMAFSDDLSHLGEKLAFRIDLEDKLIKHLH